MMDSHVRLFRARHPGNPRTVMVAYRQYILGRKRAWGTARGLQKYMDFIDSYLLAKRIIHQIGDSHA